jgi:tRNA 2-thiouridine synthesizing protein A
MIEMTTDRVIDARGMACPGPLLSLIGAIRQAQVGEVLEVWSTDAGSVADFAAWCAATGNQLVEQSADGGIYRFIIRRKCAT